MSLWHATYVEPVLQREISVIAVLPEWAENEKRPFPAVVMAADLPCEASKLVRQYPLEKELSARGMAGLCVPGWVLEHPRAREAMGESLPAWFEEVFPVKVKYLYAQGSGAQRLKNLALL